MKKYIVDIAKNKKLHLVFIIALIIRVWGTNYGFPHILNVDEPSFVRSVLGLRFSINPHRFDWPHANFYFHFVVYIAFYAIRVVANALNLKNSISQFFPILWQDPTIFYYISRITNAFIGALTVYPLYYSTLKLLRLKNLAFFSAVILTFIPYHVYDSHLALLDTALTFWCAVSLYFIFSIVNKPSIKFFMLSGFFLGIAFSTKYNGIFYLLVVFFAVIHSLKGKSFTKKLLQFFSVSYIKKYFIFTVSFLIGFYGTNPFALLKPHLFWSTRYGRGFLFQFENVGSNEPEMYLSEFIKLFYTQLSGDLGFGLYLIVILGFILYVFFCFRNKVTNLTLFMPTLLILYMVTKERNPSHYFEFLYPLFSIFAVYFLWLLLTKISFYVKKNAPEYLLKIYVVLLIILLLPSIYGSIAFTLSFANYDTRQLGYNYLASNVGKDDLVYIYGDGLDVVNFDKINEQKLKRVDVSNVDTSNLPFYLLLSVKDLTYEDVMKGKRDTRKIKGNEGRLLKNSELLYYKIPEKYQFGPSVFIFKINEVIPK